MNKDLKSHWEKGTRVNEGNCEVICAYKGLSINKWDQESEESIIAKFLKTFRISPKSKDSIYLFRFKENAGLLKPTPRLEDDSHYTFYKCDNFTMDMIEEIGIKELKSFLEEN